MAGKSIEELEAENTALRDLLAAIGEGPSAAGRTPGQPLKQVSLMSGNRDFCLRFRMCLTSARNSDSTSGGFLRFPESEIQCPLCETNDCPHIKDRARARARARAITPTLKPVRRPRRAPQALSPRGADPTDGCPDTRRYARAQERPRRG